MAQWPSPLLVWPAWVPATLPRDFIWSAAQGLVPEGAASLRLQHSDLKSRNQTEVKLGPNRLLTNPVTH